MSVAGHIPNPGTYTQPIPEVTAIIISKGSEFIRACEDAGVKPTKRQAAKWRNHTGRAWGAKGKKAP